MNQNRQNIYDSPSSEDATRGGSGNERTGQKTDYDLLKKSRRSATVFRLVVLAFIALIGFFVIEQLKKNETQKRDTSPSVREDQPIKLRSDTILDFEGDIQGQLVMDELRELEEKTLPENGDIPFNAHWIKQAASHLLRAEKSYNNQDWADAIRHFKKARAVFPDIENLNARIGICFMRLEDYDDSAEAFTEEIGHNTNSFRVINNLGVALLADKEFSKAEKHLSRVTELAPDYAPARYNIALLYSRTDMYEEAADHFEEYLSHEPRDIEALQLYAKALIELERWEDAAEVLKTSAKHLPKAAPVHMALAHVLAQMGNEDEAMKSLEQGVSLLDRSKALALVTSPEYDTLRKRQDFKELVDELSEDA